MLLSDKVHKVGAEEVRMKRIALAAAMALALGGTAKADLFDYAELQGGLTMSPELATSGIDGDIETGFNVGGALGWQLSPELGLEAEGFFTQGHMDGPLITASYLESFSFMANLIWSFDCGGKWRPYVGAGIGGAQITVTDGTFNFMGSTDFTGDSTIVFAWQGMGGVSIPVADAISMFLEYRYQSASDADLTITNGVGGQITISQEYQSHNLSLGLHFDL